MCGGFVEIPAAGYAKSWAACRYGMPDVEKESRARVDKLVAAHKVGAIFDEAEAVITDNHRAWCTGAHIPIEVWDKVMKETAPGYMWREIVGEGDYR